MPPHPIPVLFNPQNLWSSLLRSLLLLVSPVKGRSGCMISADIVKVLDFVDSDDPVLAGEGLLNCVESGTHIWQLNASDSILGLPSWEERVVVVV